MKENVPPIAIKFYCFNMFRSEPNTKQTHTFTTIINKNHDELGQKISTAMKHDKELLQLFMEENCGHIGPGHPR